VHLRALVPLFVAMGAGIAWLSDIYSVDPPLIDGRPNLLLCLVSMPFVGALARSVDVAYANLRGLRLVSRDRTETVVVWTAQLRLLLYLVMAPAETNDSRAQLAARRAHR
jgi:hypothetical protein